MTKPYQEERFEYKGYPCVILFIPLGHRCGYVGLPTTSKFYCKNYGSIPVICHGGLTYGKTRLYGQLDKSIYWIGFDCAHAFDGKDLDKTMEYFEDMPRQELDFVKMLASLGDEVRTQEYVHKQCESIVEQIIRLESED